MSKLRYFGLLGLVAVLMAFPVSRAADTAAPEGDPLKDKGLVKVGTAYVLPVETELADNMKDLRKLKQKIDSTNKQRHALEEKLKMVKSYLANWEYQHRKVNEEFLKLNDISQKNDAIAKMNVLSDKMKEGNGVREEIEKDLGSLGTEDGTQFVNNVIDLEMKVDKAQADYKDLNADPDVKHAVETMNVPGKAKVKLGPSPEFTANTTLLKKWRGDVSSDVIPIKHENNVPVVEVTLNGTVIREMIVDSGASMVCLTADLAKSLSMIPTEKDQTIQFTMADGKVVDAKLMSLKSVRVGQFTVTDVECAVLPPTMVAAEPLLGGTFLNNFIFKMDPKAGELHLAVIAGNTKVTTAGGGKDSKKPGKAASSEKLDK